MDKLCDYDSKDGMQPSIWGPTFWFTIHLVSFNYPVQPTKAQKKAYRQWMKAIGKVLPCRSCRENYKQNLDDAKGKGSTDDYASRDAFSRFCWRLHNVVNETLRKEQEPNFEAVRHLYEGFRARCHSQSTSENHIGCQDQQWDVKKGMSHIQIVCKETDTCRSTLRVVPECQLPALSASPNMHATNNSSLTGLDLQKHRANLLTLSGRASDQVETQSEAVQPLGNGVQTPSDAVETQSNILFLVTHTDIDENCYACMPSKFVRGTLVQAVNEDAAMDYAIERNPTWEKDRLDVIACKDDGNVHNLT